MAGNKKIYVLDCGGQYCHLIASRLRRHEALSVIVPCDVPVAELNDAAARGTITESASWRLSLDAMRWQYWPPQSKT